MDVETRTNSIGGDERKAEGNIRPFSKELPGVGSACIRKRART